MNILSKIFGQKNWSKTIFVKYFWLKNFIGQTNSFFKKKIEEIFVYIVHGACCLMGYDGHGACCLGA